VIGGKKHSKNTGKISFAAKEYPFPGDKHIIEDEFFGEETKEPVKLPS